MATALPSARDHRLYIKDGCSPCDMWLHFHERLEYRLINEHQQATFINSMAANKLTGAE